MREVGAVKFACGDFVIDIGGKPFTQLDPTKLVGRGHAESCAVAPLNTAAAISRQDLTSRSICRRK